MKYCYKYMFAILLTMFLKHHKIHSHFVQVYENEFQISKLFQPSLNYLPFLKHIYLL